MTIFGSARVKGFAIYPGGFGTIDELFELLNLVQTRKLQRCPLVLVGEDYWGGLYNWLVRETADRAYIAAEDLDLVEVVPDEGWPPRYWSKARIRRS